MGLCFMRSGATDTSGQIWTFTCFKLAVLGDEGWRQKFTQYAMLV